MQSSNKSFLTLAAAVVCTTLAMFSLAPSTQDSLDQWLKESSTATAPSGTQPATQENPTSPAMAVPDYALPGAIEMSDGSVIVGHIATTGDGPLCVWVENEKRWRLVPPAAVLGMSAKIFKQGIFCPGEKSQEFADSHDGGGYPLRQLEWTLVLADGSTMTGTIKGQPLYVYPVSGGDFVTVILPDRQKGRPGQKLSDLVYPKTIIISEKAIKE